MEPRGHLGASHKCELTFGRQHHELELKDLKLSTKDGNSGGGGDCQARTCPSKPQAHSSVS